MTETQRIVVELTTKELAYLKKTTDAQIKAPTFTTMRLIGKILGALPKLQPPEPPIGCIVSIEDENGYSNFAIRENTGWWGFYASEIATWEKIIENKVVKQIYYPKELILLTRTENDITEWEEE